jgi:hypothetical protein
VKNNRDNIDDLFNKKLNDCYFPIPDAFLDDLNKRLDMKDNEKRRRFAYWWFSFLIIPVVGVFLLYISSERRRTAEDLEKNKIATIENIEDNGIESLISLDTNQFKRKYRQNSTSRTERPFDKGEDLFINRGAPYHKGRNVNTVTKSTKKTTKKNLFSDKNNSQLTKSGDFINSGLTNADSLSNDYTNPLSDLVDKEMEEDGAQGSLKDPEEIISKSKNELEQELIVPTADSNKIITSIIEKNAKPAKTNYWELQVLGGLSFTISQTKSMNFIALSNAEAPILRPQLGVEAHYNMNRISFGTGLFFHQTGEKTSYEVTNTQWVDSVFVSSYDLDSTWNNETQIYDYIQVPVYDSIPLQQTSKNNYNRGNYYSWITLPLNLRYRFTFGNYELLPALGIQFHMAAASNIGFYPNQAMSQFNEIRTNRFFISWSLQADLRRNLNNSFIFIRPQYSSGMIPVISEAFLERRYKSWGMVLGYGWKF